MTERPAERPVVIGEWIHAQEEDRDGVQVYRPAGFDLPPARGRTWFTLRPDGTAEAGTPGPDDRGASTGGSWLLNGSELTVSTLRGVEAFQILAADPELLRLRPLDISGGGPAGSTGVPQ